MWIRSGPTVVTLLAALASPAAALGHEFTITPATLVLDGSGGFQLDVGLDVDALALGLPLETKSEIVAEGMQALATELDAAAVRAAEAVRRDIRLLVDGTPARVEIEFPHRGTPAAAEADPPTVLGTLARLRGSIPDQAREVVFQASREYKTVSLRIFTSALAEPLPALLEPGAASPPFSLREGAFRSADERGVVTTYLWLGFTHIVPKGVDHVLFVLGLFLLSASWRPLLYQVTAFTAAHSITLALSMQGVVSLPERVVEPLIALSIAWVGIENTWTSKLKPWRVAVVFGFGLLHGLGFAGVLGSLGLPEGRFLAALLSFNVGVELGQLSVVAVAFVLVGRFRNLEGYRRWVVIPCSTLIAATGAWWAVTRVVG